MKEAKEWDFQVSNINQKEIAYNVHLKWMEGHIWNRTWQLANDTIQEFQTYISKLSTYNKCQEH